MNKVGRGNSGHSSGLPEVCLLYPEQREEGTTTVTNTAHFNLSLCSMYAPNTKLHARVVFSGDTEIR